MKRKRMKKAIAVSTTLALLTGLAGCGTASVEESPAQTFESGEETAEEPAEVEPVSAGKTLKIAVSSSSISEKEGTAPMEAMFEKFLESLDRGIYVNGNFVPVEVEGADWVNKDDSILKAQVAVQVAITFQGGLYRDTDFGPLTHVEITEIEKSNGNKTLAVFTDSKLREFICFSLRI